MFCSKCGLKLTTNAKFCVRCGTKMLGYTGSRMNSIDPDDFTDESYNTNLDFEEEMESVLKGNMESEKKTSSSKVALQPMDFSQDKKIRKVDRVVLDEVRPLYEKKNEVETKSKPAMDEELGGDVILTADGTISALGGHLGGSYGKDDSFTLIGMPTMDAIPEVEKDEEEEEEKKEPIQIVGTVILYLLIGLAAFTGGIMLKAIFM